MDHLTFVSEITKAIAWPATVIVTLLLFRKSVAKRLLAMTRFKWKDMELEFKQELIEAKAAAAELPPPVIEAEIIEPAALPAPSDLNLAMSNPRAAIIEGWLKVEAASFSAARTRNLILGTPVPASHLGKLLKQNGLFDPKTLSVFEKLRDLRNKAAHNVELNITGEEAVDYVETADSLARYIATKSASMN